MLLRHCASAASLGCSDPSDGFGADELRVCVPLVWRDGSFANAAMEVVRHDVDAPNLQRGYGEGVPVATKRGWS